MPSFRRGFQNPAGDFHPSIRILGDTLLIHGQTDHRSAAVPDQGQDRLERLLLAIHRVDQRLAGGDGQCQGEGFWVGRIQAERDVESLCQHLDHLRQ